MFTLSVDILVRYEVLGGHWVRMTRITIQDPGLGSSHKDEEQAEEQRPLRLFASCPAYIGGLVTFRVSCLKIQKFDFCCHAVTRDMCKTASQNEKKHVKMLIV